MPRFDDEVAIKKLKEMDDHANRPPRIERRHKVRMNNKKHTRSRIKY